MFNKLKHPLLFVNTGLAVFLCYILVLVLTGCGSMVKSSRHDIVASGEIVVTQRVEIDFSICDSFPDEAERLACIQALLDAVGKKEKEAGDDE